MIAADEGPRDRALVSGRGTPILKGMHAHFGLRAVALLGLLAAASLMPGSGLAAPGLPPSAASKSNPPDLDLSDLGERWGRGVEAAIESAYRACFRTFVIGDRILTLRIPFGENNDRAELAGNGLSIRGGGKADPRLLWDEIGKLLAAPDFAAYQASLSDGAEKAIVFDLSKRSWEENRDLFLLTRAKAGLYPGLPHKPVVLSEGEGLDAAAVYDYLFAVGGLGMDCSGFVWHSLTTVARAGGLDLARVFGRQAGSPSPTTTSLYIGTWFFTPNNKAFDLVDDRIDRLQPADIIVFRDEKGVPVHSAVIQSIDLKAGRLRYLQSTDEAPRNQRGVHESYINFDPAAPRTRLGDPSVIWLQTREAAFSGEPASTFMDDGARYRAWTNEGVYARTGRGGGFVVRLKALAPAIKRLTQRGLK
jgi:hypothetical protein